MECPTYTRSFPQHAIDGHGWGCLRPERYQQARPFNHARNTTTSKREEKAFPHVATSTGTSPYAKQTLPRAMCTINSAQHHFDLSGKKTSPFDLLADVTSVDIGTGTTNTTAPLAALELEEGLLAVICDSLMVDSLEDSLEDSGTASEGSRDE